MKTSIAQSVRGIVKSIVPKRIYLWAEDFPYVFFDIVTKPPDNMLAPPLRMQHDGTRGYDAFRRNGEEALTFYREVLGMNQESTILDIGSGVGRKTIPLTRFLGSDGLYVGVDVSEKDVDWCSRNITTIAPRIVFIKLDVHNSLYNPRGRIRPDQVTLPFADRSFDFVLLWSVFTHMFPREIDHYICEATRVLKIGGTLAASFFIMNESSKKAIEGGKAECASVHSVDDLGCWTPNLRMPTTWIAIDEDWLRRMYQSRNLSIQLPIMYGAWAGRLVDPRFRIINHQDIVVSHREQD